MTTVRIPITELWQGTSNQHPGKRRPGQAKSSTNIRYDPAHGACRRNGTDLLADFEFVDDDHRYIQFKGRYLVRIGDRSVRVFDLEDGTEISVADSTGGMAYLTGATESEIRTAPLLDSLIILNRSVTTRFYRTNNYNAKGEVTEYVQLFEVPEDEDAPDPTQAKNGHKWRVYESSNSYRSGFYESDGEGGWTLVSPPLDDDARPVAETLPHRLVHDVEADTWTFEACPWLQRLSGINAINPPPEWADRKLDDVAQLQGRLAIIGAGTCFLSEVISPTRSAFNLYDYNSDVQTDADRIVFPILNSDIGSIRYAETFGNELVLLGENGIGIITSGLDPVSATSVRDYEAQQLPLSDIRPATTGTEMYVLDQLNRIHLLTLGSSGMQYAGAVNEHRVDILDDETVNALAASYQTLFVLTQSGGVKVLERYARGNNTFQLAWSEYSLNERVVWLGLWDEEYRLLTTNGGSKYSFLKYRHREPDNPTNIGYEICLDRRENLSGTYDPSTNETSWTISERYANEDVRIVLFRDENGNLLNQPMTPIRRHGMTVYLTGKWTSYNAIVGFAYTSELVLSELWAGQSAVRVILSTLNVGHWDSTDYEVIYTDEGGIEMRSSWSCKQTNVDLFDAIAGEEGISTHVVLGDAQRGTLAIRSDSPGYFAIPFVEYEARVRGRNRG